MMIALVLVFYQNFNGSQSFFDFFGLSLRVFSFLGASKLWVDLQILKVPPETSSGLQVLVLAEFICGLVDGSSRGVVWRPQTSRILRFDPPPKVWRVTVSGLFGVEISVAVFSESSYASGL